MPDFKGLPFDSDAKLRKKRYGRTGASGGTLPPDAQSVRIAK